MRILVATDLSPRSDRALARAYGLAQELKAELEILYVADADQPAELKTHAIEWARAALEKETAVLEASTGVKAHAEVLAGHPKTDIAIQASARKADLIVLGTHNRAAMPTKRSFAATTAGQIVKASRLPVLLVREDATRPYREVAIGVDFSVYSRAALREGFRLAPAARFHLIHAFEVPFKGFMSSESSAQEIALDQRLEFDAFLKEEMDLLARRGIDKGIPADRLEKIVREGDARMVVPAECERIGADVVVIGTHGRTGVSAAIWGSVATDLLNNPPTDVLVVKAF
ncbi:MAG: universal stress protein [Rhodospirillaceae bacterium]|nr:universal stress protein [Rhodospirillaceae bacterium]